MIVFLSQGLTFKVSKENFRSILATMSSKCVLSNLTINSTADSGSLWEYDRIRDRYKSLGTAKPWMHYRNGLIIIIVMSLPFGTN